MQALRQWEEGGRFAEDILHESLTSHQFSTLDRALLTETFYGIIRNLSLIDFIIGQMREEPLDSFTRQVLRLGIYQIFRMRVPHHAAVNETVNLAGRARSLVNAILRRSIREQEQLNRQLETAEPAILFSHPEHLIERWEKNFGEQATRALCQWNNDPAEVFVRANALKVTPGELLLTSPDAEPFEAHPLVLRVKQVPLRWILFGLCYVQDPSTLMACELLAPEPGDRILDACAAPGGKTSYLAQLMQNTGEIIACDASANRLTRLAENLERLSVRNVKIEPVDWLEEPPPFAPESFDRILLDAPCSNTGVIRRRVDVRWRLEPGDFTRMPELQFAIMKKVVPLLKKGGSIVYSSCSLEPEENEKVVERVGAEFPDLHFIESRQSLPFRDHIDGAFAAKFVRE